jgi:hypothetical protein
MTKEKLMTGPKNNSPMNPTTATATSDLQRLLRLLLLRPSTDNVTVSTGG